MGKDTKISWCDASFNPWFGCSKVPDSPACHFCYAEAFTKRIGNKVWGPRAPRRFFGDKHWDEPLKWNEKAEKEGVRRSVFCASMGDIFEDRRDLVEPRRRLWSLVDKTLHLLWLLLSKRSENILDMIPQRWIESPPPNVMYGATAENQDLWDKRTAELCRVPAAGRFVSMEPLLGPVDLEFDAIDIALEKDGAGNSALVGPISWVIVGGESGPKARPMEIEWVRSVVRQCQAAGVPVHVKQLGRSWYEDDKYGQRRRVGVEDAAGRDPAEWPKDLRVQEFPEMARAV